VVDVKRVGSAGGERDIVVAGFGGREDVGGIELAIWIWRRLDGKVVAVVMSEVFGAVI
jgi:hypothetical protein